MLNMKEILITHQQNYNTRMNKTKGKFMRENHQSLNDENKRYIDPLNIENGF